MPLWSEIMLKSIATIVIMFAMTRLLGKKQIAQLSFFEYVVGITLGEVAGFMSIDIEDRYLYGIVALLSWTLVPFVIEFLSLKSKFLRNILEGRGTILVKDGKVLEDNLKKERYSTDELLQQLRQRNAFRVADVEFAVLEANGELSVLMKKEKQPLTPSDLGIRTAPEQEPQTVVMDGNVMDEPLATMGLNRGWLMAELDKLGVSLDNVYLGQVNTYGELTVDLYDDRLEVPRPSERLLLMATLKKCQADLELFALGTEDADTRSLYARNAANLQKAIERVRPYLAR